MAPSVRKASAERVKEFQYPSYLGTSDEPTVGNELICVPHM